jgi:hypothetical protein
MKMEMPKFYGSSRPKRIDESGLKKYTSILSAMKLRTHRE